jgi:hypothetical protein
MDSASRFYGDVPFQAMQFFTQLADGFKNHRLTAGDHDMTRIPLRGRRQNGRNVLSFTFRIP